jgi:hypothetical protein
MGIQYSYPERSDKVKSDKKPVNPVQNHGNSL